MRYLATFRYADGTSTAITIQAKDSDEAFRVVCWLIAIEEKYGMPYMSDLLDITVKDLPDCGMFRMTANNGHNVWPYEFMDIVTQDTLEALIGLQYDFTVMNEQLEYAE